MELSKKNFIYFFIFILYIVLLFIVGYHHEPWGDEAQCWLIARDNSFLDILFHETRYEGHPFLWFFIEKLYINTHLASSTELYRWIFIFPLVFSAIGVYFFLFKSKFPLIIKCLVPFTFYIFFQYGVVARNHSLCFPFLMIIAAFYHKRFEHPYIYALLLFLTANVSAYTFLVAGVLFIFFIVDIIREKLEIKKYLAPLLITGFSLLFSAALLRNPADCYVVVSAIMTEWLKRIYHIAAAYFPIRIHNKTDIILGSILTLLFYLSVMKAYCKNKYQVIFFISLNLPLFLFYVLIYGRAWHYGYAGIFLLFTCWLLTEMNEKIEIPFKKNWLLYVFLIFIFVYYISGTVRVSEYDLNNSYDDAKPAADFIKKYNLTQYQIVGAEFKTVGLQPHFEKSIYSNYSNKTHYFWQSDFYEENQKKLLEYPPIMIFMCHFYRNLPKEKLQKYNQYTFAGYMPALNLTQDEDELNEYNILINKELVEKIPGLSDEKTDSYFGEEE